MDQEEDTLDSGDGGGDGDGWGVFGDVMEMGRAAGEVFGVLPSDDWHWAVCIY